MSHASLNLPLHFVPVICVFTGLTWSWHCQSSWSWTCPSGILDPWPLECWASSRTEPFSLVLPYEAGGFRWMRGSLGILPSPFIPHCFTLTQIPTQVRNAGWKYWTCRQTGEKTGNPFSTFNHRIAEKGSCTFCNGMQPVVQSTLTRQSAHKYKYAFSLFCGSITLTGSDK